LCFHCASACHACLPHAAPSFHQPTSYKGSFTRPNSQPTYKLLFSSTCKFTRVHFLLPGMSMPSLHAYNPLYSHTHTSACTGTYIYYTHTHTLYIYIYIHTHTHTHTHAWTHTNTSTQTQHTNENTYTIMPNATHTTHTISHTLHAHRCNYTPTNARINLARQALNIHTHILTHTCINTNPHITWNKTHQYTHVNTLIYTRLHKYIHIYTHACMHEYPPLHFTHRLPIHIQTCTGI